MVKVLGIAGSLREGSYNKLLINAALNIAKTSGAETSVIDLTQLNLPILNEDDEKRNGFPEGAKRLRTLMNEATTIIFASPEYNSSVSAALKNAIDWASRPSKDTPPISCFAGKVGVILSASPGALGGLRGLVHLRSILGNLNMLVIPEQLAIGKAHEAFAPDGKLIDLKQNDSLNVIVNKAINLTKKIFV